jgi:hypothetical protein
MVLQRDDGNGTGTVVHDPLGEAARLVTCDSPACGGRDDQEVGAFRFGDVMERLCDARAGGDRSLHVGYALDLDSAFAGDLCGVVVHDRVIAAPVPAQRRAVMVGRRDDDARAERLRERAAETQRAVRLGGAVAADHDCGAHGFSFVG